MQEYTTKKKRKKRKTKQALRELKCAYTKKNDFSFWFHKNWRPVSLVNVDV